MDLKDIRKRIDEIDKELLLLIESRMKLSEEVAEYKKKTDKPIYDKLREDEKIEALKSFTKDEFIKDVIGDIFIQIMSASRRLQYIKLYKNYDLGFVKKSYSKPKVVFYGEKGSYTEQAMIEYFGDEIETSRCNTFEDVMLLVKNKDVDFGVLPIENSFTGTLSDIYDLLADYNNYIIGEHVLKIEHNLLGFQNADLDDIKTVYSHKQGILQCSKFLIENDIIAIDSGSTSSSAKRVLDENDISKAAIASERAATHFGLKIIKKHINNEMSNSTRFIIISSEKAYFEEANKISICFALPHESGSLYNTLSHFIYNGINMTRIESRPFVGKPFEYRFFVDIEGKLDDPKIKNALFCIQQEALEIKILGAFKSINKVK